ncbi:hypothetical protein M2152_000165 [Microbacteriaceae bacterium SG_E_30_P1]|uniref:Lipoprotein n=1 Tax=Antiquaquibacter oligotrophicus TaxID=2880260 RepID=A0ABT6KJ82_9MICO|nr:hypothetical protein [Antiquaquibacter oligotrophicus]MDH6179983.1 hypothetical protein [Antiquaquibacter oligotrophicus]UDF14261.1 hypothetical protein LH407_05205 [Antiquaquibacter oligotrophicus]
MQRLLFVGAATVVLLTGCSAAAPPEASGIDPRCREAYPAVDYATLGYTGSPDESLLTLRPDQWPAVPDFAVFCWSTLSAAEEVAYYAIDTEVPYGELYDYYEESFGDLGIHGRAPSDTGELLTGVFPPEHSYFVDYEPQDAYSITWALQGEYSD